MIGRLGRLGRLGGGGVGILSASGATWNEAADSYTKIGGSAYPVHDAMQPCLVTPGLEGTGDILLWKSDYTKRADTGATVALDGGNGQVMMRLKKFYYKYSYAGSTHNWQVSLVPRVGFAVHPCFVKAGVEVPYRYIGICLSTWYDVSAAAYVAGDGTNAGFDAGTDKIGSVVGKKPLSNKTRSQFRAAAARVGAGWQLMDFNLYAALKMLYITRYANWNSQSTVGAGNTQWGSFDFATIISATGKVLSVTAPGKSTAGGNSGDYCNLFGIENLWGDLWQFIDGWNISSGANYVCSNPENLADDTITNYGLYGSTNATLSGWQNALQQNAGMLPASVGASSVTKVTDYYWYLSGWRVPLVGGYAVDGERGGLAALYAYGASSVAYSNIGGRLCF